MTTIFTVSVDSIEGPTLRGRVHLINPDVPLAPKEPVFPLSLLVDVWWHLDNGFLRDEDDENSEELARNEDHGWDRNPWSEQQGKDAVAGMRRRSEYARLYELVLGRTVRVTKDGYLLTEDGSSVLEPRRKAADVYELSGGSGYDGVSHYVMTPGNAEEFSRRAADIVASYDVGPYQNVPLLSEVAAAQNPDQPWDPELPDGPRRPRRLRHLGRPARPSLPRAPLRGDHREGHRRQLPGAHIRRHALVDDHDGARLLSGGG
ncbi:hypothetical protein HUT18_22095 [Streptomyces sp. NA04227]|uniref:hypothetical protein n=1 Tax=Streptomyces sp. NA04227 TaxID=2742136 RepID=UPI001590BB29|nr:hypothetical protein [Streptomyces sp. NA04227]QKW08666.1 hypothetical protein HUT18_22095 [Streptomyces sp. NA04227]